MRHRSQPCEDLGGGGVSICTTDAGNPEERCMSDRFERTRIFQNG